MNAEQAALDFDARSWAERRSDEYRASLSARARVTGQSRAAKTDPEGFERAFQTITTLAELGRQFDAGDVRAWAGPFETGNVIGAAFSAAKKAGLIRVAGYAPSKTATDTAP